MALDIVGQLFQRSRVVRAVLVADLKVKTRHCLFVAHVLVL